MWIDVGALGRGYFSARKRTQIVLIKKNTVTAMCGRFSLATTKEKLQQQLQLLEMEDELLVSYNIAPTQLAYVVTNENPGRLETLNWGLVPRWSPDGKNGGKLINARREDIAEKPSFREPIRRHRCLVPADSFYEWRREGKRKLPYRILLKNGDLMVFAGIWDTWQKGEVKLKTFSIITTEANAEMADLHNRMPVLLTTREEQRSWLASEDLEEVLGFLRTPEEGIIYRYRVTDQLNTFANNYPQLHLEIKEPPTLFG